MIGMDFGAFLTLLIFGVDRIDRRARHRSVSDAGGRRWFRLGADGGLDRGLARFPCPRPLVVPGPRSPEMLRKASERRGTDPDSAERAMLQLLCAVPVNLTTLTVASERGGASSGRRFQQTAASFP